MRLRGTEGPTVSPVAAPTCLVERVALDGVDALAGAGVAHAQGGVASGAAGDQQLAVRREAAARHRAAVPREHLLKCNMSLMNQDIEHSQVDIEHPQGRRVWHSGLTALCLLAAVWGAAEIRQALM